MAAAAMADGGSTTSDAAAVATGNVASRICRRETCSVVVPSVDEVQIMP